MQAGSLARWAFVLGVAVRLGLTLSAAAALVLPLGSCAGTGSHTGQADTGTVVVAVTADKRYPTQLAPIAVFWRQYDPASQKLMPAGGSFSVDRRHECFWTFGDKSPCIQPRHEAFTVPPGDYILTNVMSWRLSGVTQEQLETSFVEGEPLGGFHPKAIITSSRTPDDASTAKSRAPRFSVAKGEVVYIGTFLFDTFDQPHRVREVLFDAESAKSAVDPEAGDRLQIKIPKTAPAKPNS